MVLAVIGQAKQMQQVMDCSAVRDGKDMLTWMRGSYCFKHLQHSVCDLQSAFAAWSWNVERVRHDDVIAFSVPQFGFVTGQALPFAQINLPQPWVKLDRQAKVRLNHFSRLACAY